MRKDLYLALMAYADDPTWSNRLRLYYEIRQERIDASPEDDALFAEIADVLEDKPDPAHGKYYF